MTWFRAHFASQHVRHVARHQGHQESLAAKGRGRVCYRERTQALWLCPCLGVQGLCLECQLSPRAPTRPPQLSAKEAGNDNSCSNLLVVSVHDHQPSLGRTTLITARQKWRMWLEAGGKTLLHHVCFTLHRLHFQLSCLSLKWTRNPLLNDVL